MCTLYQYYVAHCQLSEVYFIHAQCVWGCHYCLFDFVIILAEFIWKNWTALLLLKVISCYKLFKLENDSTLPKFYSFSDINTHYLNILINNGYLKIVNNTNSFKCVEISAVNSFDGSFTVKCWKMTVTMAHIKFYIFINLLLILVINIINVILKLFIDHFMLIPIKYLCHVYIKVMLMF